MFYSTDVLTKKGALSKAWLAAHWDKKLNRQQVMTTDLEKLTDDICDPTVPLALRMSGHLLVGVVKIYNRKVDYLYKDTHDSSVKIRMVRGRAAPLPFFFHALFPVRLTIQFAVSLLFPSHRLSKSAQRSTWSRAPLKRTCRCRAATLRPPSRSSQLTATLPTQRKYPAG